MLMVERVHKIEATVVARTVDDRMGKGGGKPGLLRFINNGNNLWQ